MVGTVGDSQHHGAGATPDAVEAPLIHRTYYEAREAGRDAERHYRGLFERKVQDYVLAELQSKTGSSLPDDMQIVAPDLDKVEEIYQGFYDIWDVFDKYHEREFTPTAFASKLINDMACFDDMYDLLTNNILYFQSLELRKVISNINLSLRDFYNNRKLFQAFDTVLADLSAGHKGDALGELISLVKASTHKNGLPLFPELLEILSSIKSFSKGKIAREALAQTDGDMYTIYATRLRECFFRGDDGIGHEGYQAFKALFNFYLSHFDYYYELLALKYHYAEAYFDRFMHKVIQSQIERRLDNQAPISKAEYDAFKSQVRGACLVLHQTDELHKHVQHEAAKPLIILRELFVRVHETFEQAPLESIQIAKEMKVDPRSELLRDSYVRLLESLYDLRTRYLGEK